MRKITLIIMSLFFVSSAFSQSIVSATPIGSKSKDEIGTIFGLPIFLYGADMYKVLYQSKDAKGNADTLSALLLVPDVAADEYPVLFYEHGTSSCKECIPSHFEQDAGGDEGRAGLLFAGMGYISLLPDYVGMGNGRGFQTYVHYETSVSASEDLLKAFKAWAPSQNILFNDQLFITGYSQGGYAAMAFHKAMQEKYGASFITAAAHNSGPYSLSGVMRDLILNDTSYAYPAYIPNTMLGMNEVYQMYPNIADFFKPTFVPDIQAYYDGDISLIDLNQRLIDTLFTNFGDTVANRMIIDSILSNIDTIPNHIINQILSENDVHKWVPESPTRIFYCQKDDQVPYMNAVVALDTMYARGADQTLVKAADLDPTQDHAGCVQPAFLNTLQHFNVYKQITVGVNSLSNLEARIYPNPVNDRLFIELNLHESSTVNIWNLNGQLQKSLTSTEFKQDINVSDLEEGMYIMEISTESGASNFHNFVVVR